MTFTADEIADVVGIYGSNPEYCRAAGEYDPEHIEPDRVEADLREEARSEGVMFCSPGTAVAAPSGWSVCSTGIPRTGIPGSGC